MARRVSDALTATVTGSRATELRGGGSEVEAAQPTPGGKSSDRQRDGQYREPSRNDLPQWEGCTSNSGGGMCTHLPDRGYGFVEVRDLQ